MLLIVVGADGCSNSGDLGGRADSGALDWGVLKCGDGLVPRGPACVPVFDYCKAGEVSLLGGGCMRVGPPAACLAGWKMVKGGWCEPIRPRDACPSGRMAVIGESSCQPIRDCGNHKYGNIKASVKTIYVDRQYAGSNADGSQAKPYQSIDEALSAAPSGAHIAVAAGEYLEDLVINKSVTLEGRCPGLVTVKGYKKDHTATIQVTASGTVVRGLTVTGSHSGVALFAATGVVVEKCAITDNALLGVLVSEKSALTVRHTLVARNHAMAVMVQHNSAVTLDTCVLRETKEKLFEKRPVAWGIGAQTKSSVSVQNSIITSNGHRGINLVGGTGAVVGCEISETWDGISEKGEGIGVVLESGSALIIQRSLLKNNRVIGLAVLDSKVTVESSVIRTTLPRRYDQTGGVGILVKSTSATSTCKLELKDSLVSRSPYMGIAFFNGGQATIERSVISETGTPACKWAGSFGIWVATSPTKENPLPVKTILEIKNTVVDNSRYGGVWASGGADLTIHRSVVRDIFKPAEGSASSSKIGVGVWVQELPEVARLGYRVSLLLRESLVERIQGLGVSVADSGKARIERSLVRDSLPVQGWPTAGVSCFSTKKDPALTGPVLDMQDSAIEKIAGEGIHLEGTRATVRRTMVTDTSKPYGYGISVNQGKEAPATELLLDQGLIQNSDQAGLVFFGGSGKVCRSILRGNKYAIDLENGTAPVICDDNRYENNERDVAFGQGLKKVQVPTIPDIPKRQ